MKKFVKPKIEQSQIKGQVTDGIRNLKRADFKPYVWLRRDIGKKRPKPHLVSIRKGIVHSEPISKRVAEELIAAGFSCGD